MSEGNDGGDVAWIRMAFTTLASTSSGGFSASTDFTAPGSKRLRPGREAAEDWPALALETLELGLNHGNVVVVAPTLAEPANELIAVVDGELDCSDHLQTPRQCFRLPGSAREPVEEKDVSLGRITTVDASSRFHPGGTLEETFEMLIRSTPKMMR